MGLFSSLSKAFTFSFNVLDDARPLSAREQRGLALGAVYAVEGDLPINALTMQADQRTATRLLGQAWDVHGPEDVDTAYRFLLDGGHDRYYRLIGPEVMRLAETGGRRKDYAVAAGLIRDRADSLGLDAEPAEAWFTGWSLSLQSGGHEHLPHPLPESITAWDAARVVHLSRLMVDAGYASEHDAFDAVSTAVETARQAHHSWQEFGAAFLTGRAFWKARDVRNPVDSEAVHFTKAVKDLHTRDGSPWLTLPW